MGTLAAYFDQFKEDTPLTSPTRSTGSGCSRGSDGTFAACSTGGSSRSRGGSVTGSAPRSYRRRCFSSQKSARLRKPSTHRIWAPKNKRKRVAKALRGCFDAALCRRNLRFRQGLGLRVDLCPKDFCHLEESRDLQYKLGDVIGNGSYSTVRLGLEVNSGKLLAIKQMRMADRSDDRVVQAMQREVAILNGLQHPNLVRYVGAQCRGKIFEIVLEYCDGNSIANLLRQFGPLREALVRHFATGLFSGLCYLHEHRIIHGDIKGANCLITTDGCLKLADFGCSKKLQGLTGNTMKDKSLKKIRGSIPWMAPEVARGDGYKTSSDIWSAGATVLEMYLGKPWIAGTSMSAAFKIGDLQAPPQCPDGTSSVARDFVGRCMVIDCKKRAVARTLVRHVFLCSGTLKSSRDITMLGRDKNLRHLVVNNANFVSGSVGPVVMPDDRTPKRWFTKKNGFFFNWRQQRGGGEAPSSI